MAAEGAVPRDDRVRITCSVCGRTGSLSAADFAKLRAGGGRAQLPGMQVAHRYFQSGFRGPRRGFRRHDEVLDHGQLGRVPGGERATDCRWRHHGVHVSRRHSKSSGNKMPPAPQQDRAATVAMSASGGQAQQPTPGQNRPMPRRGSATLIESALPPSADAAALATFKTRAASDAERSGSDQGPQSAGNVKLGTNKPWVWIAFGAGAATLLVAVASVAFFPSTSKKEPVPGPSQPDTTTQVQTPGRSANRSPKTSPGSSTQPSSAQPLAKNSETLRLAGGSTSSEGTDRPTEGSHASPAGTAELASTEHPATTKKTTRAKAQGISQKSAPARSTNHLGPPASSPRVPSTPLACRKSHANSIIPSRKYSPKLSPIATRSSSLQECTASLAQEPIIKPEPENTGSPSVS